MNRRYRYIIILVFQITLFGNLYSQERIEDYEDICYCSVGILHPASILKLDNNLEILVSLKKGKTLKELDSLNISYNKSQIILLQTSNLIKRKGSKYYSLIPILNEQESNKLRKQTNGYAKEIVGLIENEYSDFAQILKSKGFESNTFTIFFSYVLDEIVWEIFEERKITKELQTSKKEPYWNGVMWMIYPKRDFSCGTNFMYTDNSYIGVNWSDNSKIDFTSYNLLYDLLSEYDSLGMIKTDTIIKEFKDNKIFDENGVLHIPIIKSNNMDNIYAHSYKIASIIADYIDKKIDYNQIQKDYLLKDKNQSVIILYHEIMWDILDVMIDKEVLVLPIAFGKPDKSKKEDLKDLIFIIEE
ncbi:MAG: hypothetical protein GXO79_06470 [Chlorobi bacterium]|nr:hypothetical protein [Chlorobiota bacterium]